MDALERLRGLLHSPPSHWGWAAICEALEGLSAANRAVGLEYAREHLRRWPDGMRTCWTSPQEWTQAPPCWWPLVRPLSIKTFRQGGARDDFGAFFAGPHLEHITSLEFLDNRALMNLPQAEHLMEARIAWEPPQTLGTLGLEGCIIGAGGTEKLAKWAGLRHLHTLDLTCNRIGDEGLTTLLSSPHIKGLQTLGLFDNRLTDDGLWQLGQSPNVRSLHALNLGWNRTGERGVQALAHSDHLQHLTSINFARNAIGDAAVQHLANSPRMQHLRALGLEHCGLGHESLMALANSPHMGQLRALDLGKMRSSAQGIRALARSPNIKHLHTLYLDGVGLNSDAAVDLFESASLSRLQRLSLVDNGLNDDFAHVLAASDHMGALRVLNLSVNRIHKAGFLALLQSTSLPNLHRLDLSDNPLGGPWPANPSTARPQHIHTLDLSDNKISDDGLQGLLQQQTLEALRAMFLDHTSISESGLEALSNTPLPNLHTIGLTDQIFKRLEPFPTQALAQSTNLHVVRRVDGALNRPAWEVLMGGQEGINLQAIASHRHFSETLKIRHAARHPCSALTNQHHRMGFEKVPTHEAGTTKAPFFQATALTTTFLPCQTASFDTPQPQRPSMEGESLPSLRVLRLGNTGLDDDALLVLFQCLDPASVRTLDLADNPITDQTLQRLAASPQRLPQLGALKLPTPKTHETLKRLLSWPTLRTVLLEETRHYHYMRVPTHMSRHRQGYRL